MIVMDMADSALRLLDGVRADIGAAQRQLETTINNVAVTRINVEAAQSTIRDLDFGEEIANFSKQNILSQSGSYALSQANATQETVTQLFTQ